MSWWWVVAAVLGLWLVANVVAQLPGPVGRRVAVGSRGLAPRWWFFAPDPAPAEYSLVAVGSRTDGTVRITAHPATSRHRLPAVWNPGLRAERMLLDAVAELSAVIRQHADDGRLTAELVKSPAYAVLLERAQRLLSDHDVNTCRFEIWYRKPGAVASKLWLRSAWHPRRWT